MTTTRARPALRPRQPVSAVVAGLAIAGLAAVTGCSSSKTYSVEVRNEATSLVRARIVLDPPLEADVTLNTTDIRPGERATLGATSDHGSGRIALSVSQPSEIGIPPVEERLEPGRSAYEATNQTNFGVEGITLRKLGPPTER